VVGPLEEFPLLPEPTEVGDAVCRAVARTRDRGGRVVAVGTTVVRALASAPHRGGVPEPFAGVAEAMVTPGHRPSSVDGLVTGLHAPETSHLALLEAFLPAAHLRTAYQEALESRFLWHEFGDVHLIIPGSAS
jgi:S-adenosylmethionine:tRNA ribosyltransferase-isomerase